MYGPSTSADATATARDDWRHGITPAQTATGVAALIDVICCDGASCEPVVSAAQQLGCEVRRFESPQKWADRWGSPDHPLADVVALVAAGDRLLGHSRIWDTVSVGDDALLMVAVTDASIDHVSALVNRGVNGFLHLPSTAEQLASHLGDIAQRALLTRPKRQAALEHRRSLAKLADGERQVLERMLEGLANKQIAQRLSIGLRTVELRRSKIMRKMGATNLPQLISFVCLADAGLCAVEAAGDASRG